VRTGALGVHKTAVRHATFAQRDRQLVAMCARLEPDQARRVDPGRTPRGPCLVRLGTDAGAATRRASLFRGSARGQPNRQLRAWRSTSLACAISPSNKPIDAAANEQDWKACTYDRTWCAPNTSLIVVVLPLIVLSQRRNAECQQQGSRQKHVFHQMSSLCWVDHAQIGTSYSIN
jgi:hypothetical protein